MLCPFCSHQNDPDKASNMPRDGTVHELTNHVSLGALRPLMSVLFGQEGMGIRSLELVH